MHQKCTKNAPKRQKCTKTSKNRQKCIRNVKKPSEMHQKRQKCTREASGTLGRLVAPWSTLEHPREPNGILEHPREPNGTLEGQVAPWNPAPCHVPTPASLIYGHRPLVWSWHGYTTRPWYTASRWSEGLEQQFWLLARPPACQNGLPDHPQGSEIPLFGCFDPLLGVYLDPICDPPDHHLADHPQGAENDVFTDF